MKVQKNSKEIQFVVKQIQAHCPKANIFGFGSHMKGTSKQFSDLDILIDIGSKIPLEVLSTLK